MAAASGQRHPAPIAGDAVRTSGAEHTFLIADMAGAFVAGFGALLAGHQAQTVKTMGDAVLVRFANAERALCLAACAVGELGARHGALGVRVGMHTGPAVERDGDWFGATVNVGPRRRRGRGRRGAAHPRDARRRAARQR